MVVNAASERTEYMAEDYFFRSSLNPLKESCISQPRHMRDPADPAGTLSEVLKVKGG